VPVTPGDKIEETLSRLTAEIAEAERRLDSLKIKIEASRLKGAAIAARAAALRNKR
jgi:hypothetical protein